MHGLLMMEMPGSRWLATWRCARIWANHMRLANFELMAFRNTQTTSSFAINGRKLTWQIVKSKDFCNDEY